MYLSRYRKHGRSIFLPPIYSSQSVILTKLSYISARNAVLDPISDPKTTTFQGKDKTDEQVTAGVLTNIIQHPLKHHRELVLKHLPSFGDSFNANDQSQVTLLKRKLKLCCHLCCFIDPQADLDAKKVKEATLKELLPIFSTNSYQLSSNIIDQFFQMISTNLFRDILPIDKKYLVFDDEPAIIDVAWSHLQPVYALLLGYQKIFPTDSHFSPFFSMQMVNLLNSADVNERDQVLSWLNVHALANPSQRSKIIAKIMDLLEQYISGKGPKPPFVVLPSLKFIIFLLHNGISAEVQSYFSTVLVPLVAGQHLFAYLPQLGLVFTFFASQNSKVISKLVRRLIFYWPVAAPSKQSAFIALINEIVEMLPLEDFEKIAPELFQLYAACSLSTHAGIAEASFAIWSNVKIVPMILSATNIIFPIIYPALNKAAKESWNSTTQMQALNTLQTIHAIDPVTYKDISKRKTTANSVPIFTEGISQANPVHKSWATIARAAAKTDRSVNLAKILTEIQIKFNAPNEGMEKSKSKIGLGIRAKIYSPGSLLNLNVCSY